MCYNNHTHLKIIKPRRMREGYGTAVCNVLAPSCSSSEIRMRDSGAIGVYYYRRDCIHVLFVVVRLCPDCLTMSKDQRVSNGTSDWSHSIQVLSTIGALLVVAAMCCLRWRIHPMHTKSMSSL